MKTTRRRFTAEYKLRVLREADACMEPGEIGALLRQEGLYPSPLCLWRKQRRARELMGLAPPARPGAEGDEPADGEGGGIGEENAVAESPC